MRKNIVAGNWKMNNDLAASKKLANQVAKLVKKNKVKGTKVIIAPTFVNLERVAKATKKSKVKVAAQNMHFAESGAFTGEISPKMLKSIGVKTVILGHSERRSLYHENNASLANKVNTSIESGMEIVFCFGEQLEERKSNRHFDVVKEQLSEALFSLSAASWSQVVLAYEPVWAIGTGETASPDQAQEMHAFIRNLIQEKYTENLAQEVAILYGGSVKPGNAKEIFSMEDVDGGLIGGASLNADDFMAIVNAF